MFWVASRSGLLALLLIGVLALIPYLARWLNRRQLRLGLSYWSVMSLHQFIGLTTLALVIVHMDTSMGAGLMSRVNPAGLNFATIGLYAFFAQSVVGIMLMKPDPDTRPLWKRVHFSLMVGILGLVIAHVYLNGMIIYSWF